MTRRPPDDLDAPRNRKAGRNRARLPKWRGTLDEWNALPLVSYRTIRLERTSSAKYLGRMECIRLGQHQWGRANLFGGSYPVTICMRCGEEGGRPG